MTLASVVTLDWHRPGQTAEPVLINRPQAIARRLPRYFTGKPCHAGHLSERVTVDRTCCECSRLRHRAERQSTIQALKGST